MKREKIKHIDEKKLSAWLDKELDESQSREVESHLETCRHCRKIAAELKGVSRSLGMLQGLEPDPFFAARVKKRVLGKRPGRAWRKVLLPALAGAAAAVSIAAGGFIGQIMYAATTRTETVQTELTSYLGTSPAQDFPEGSLGEVLDEVFPENGASGNNGGNS